MNIPVSLKQIVSRVVVAGGRALLVGGAVRDFISTGDAPKDFDVEIHGLSVDTVKALLSESGDVKAVGESFGVLKLTDADRNEFDFSLPRRESKQGKGHKGFIVELDETMTPKEAAARRDFTINSMMFDLATGELDDPFDGRKDLAAGILRHTSEAFADDPLRPLRAMQFAGRFGFTVAPETCELAKTLVKEFHTLSVERVWGEWHKWATKSRFPSKGIQALVDMGWDVLFPEIAVLKGLEQDEQWHPEGNVLNHTMHTVDAALEIADRDGLIGDERAVALFGALCHDFGKDTTTSVNEEGRIISHGHDRAGVPIAEAFMTRIGAPNAFVVAVPVLVGEHMVHVSGNLCAKGVRRLADRIDGKTTIEMLDRIIEADHCGRPPLPKAHPVPELMQLARELAVERSKPQPILMGRHLIGLGMKPGHEFGRLLKAAYELQLNGVLCSEHEALDWVRAQHLQ